MSENRKAFEALLRDYLKKTSVEATTDCPDENMVTAYLEGVLPQRVKEDLERHAALCPRCQQELVLLLKSESSPLATSSQEVQHAKGNWITFALGSLERVRNLGLKPALAILVATVISGYLGYELFQLRQEKKVGVTELSQSVPDAETAIKETGSSLEPELDQAKQKKVSSGLENESKTKGRSITVAKKPAIHRQPLASPPVAFSDATRDEYHDKLLSDNSGLHPTPSSETDKMSSSKPSPEGLAKEERKGKALFRSASQAVSATVQESRALNALKQPPAPSESNVAITQPSREKQSAPEKVSSPAGPEAPTKNDDESKDAASSERARVAGLATARSKLGPQHVADARAERGDVSPEEKKPVQIEVSGKTFELRNNVWVDLSIEEKEKKTPTFIYKNSSRYQEQVKPLSPYQSVLSRPEDCLIQQDGKIYYVKSSP